MPRRSAVFPGTFDPITYGHLDVIKRGSEIFDKLYVGVAKNSGKSPPLFSAAERVELIAELVIELKNVEVVSFAGMTVDFVKNVDAGVILRGIRTFGDFEYEFQLGLANRSFSGVETVFVMASEENSFVRSTLIKDAASLGADVERFVPETVAKRLRELLIPRSSDASGLQGDEKV